MGQVELRPAAADLHEQMRSIVRLLEPKAKAKGITFTSEFQPDVPRWVVCDAGRMRQVALNLAGNAVKFTERGSVNLSISLTPGETSGSRMLRFEIRDTGIGIEPGIQDRLFKPFVQADGSSTRRFGGTGLGLSICRRLAELMGGQVGLTSKLNIGSTFWFTIPFQPSEVPATERAETSGAGPLKSLRILVVDDNPVNLRVTRGILEKLGCQCVTATNGVEALEAMSEATFSAILMDCQMPVMDGFAATAEIRRREGEQFHTPIIAVTANAMDHDRERCLAAGMDSYISKPVGIAKLKEILQSARQVESRMA